MVGIGTIIGGITLVIGAVVGYAIYSNRGKIQDATTNIIGGIESSAMAIGSKSATSFENIIPSFEKVTLPNPFTAWWESAFATAGPKKTTYVDYQGKSTEKDIIPMGDPFPTPKKDYTPSYKAGYYYLDYNPSKSGKQWDTQVFLSKKDAGLVATLGSQANFRFLGIRKLSTSQFQQYGKSKGYL